MNRRTDSKVTASHTDAFTSEFSTTEGDGEYDREIQYDPGPTTEGLGPIEERGRDLDIEHPVENTEELTHRAHLAVQFAESNRLSRQSEVGVTANGTADDVAATFDEAILDIAAMTLEAEGLSFATLPIPEDHSKALVLHDAWRMNSYPALTKHLVDTESTAQLLGYDSVPDQSTFWKASNRLEEESYREAITAAATRAVHAVFRNGIETPETVIESYGLDISPALDEREVADETRRVAIRHWVEFLLDESLDPVSFGRAENKSYTVDEILAAIAQAGLVNGPNSARPSAAWYYDAGDIPTASQLSRLMTDLDRNEIVEMFTAVNRRFIRTAKQLGFFQNAYDYALDTTWVDWGGIGDGDDPETDLINNPKETDTGAGWLFAALGVMDRNARFTLGIDLVTDKSETTEYFRYLLRTVARETDIGRIHIDREFYDGDAVRLCRALAGRNWTIRGKKTGDMGELLAETKTGETGFRENIDFSDVTPGPNAYVHPIPDDLRTDSGSTHMGFITDLSPDETDLRGIYYVYQKRWSIEKFFDQLKNDFAAPSNSPSSELRFFLLNIAALYYNFHTLMNRAPSPTYGLRLDVPFYEVLIAIVDVVYTRSGATES